MGWKLQLFVVGIAIVGGLYLAGFFSPEPPNLDPGEGWWAKEDKGTVKVDTSVKDFKIVFPQKDQDDLKRRLENTRYFESLEGTNWEYGIRADEMKKIVNYWLTNYSWPKQEKVFNQYKHYKTNIEGLDIHFVRVKPNLKPGQKAKPILMVHGWPGSFYEFYKIIPMLIDPTHHGGSEDDIFEVICPSLPGYGFSEAAHKPGLNPKDIARMFNTLMHERLGFDSYYVQGGDWGGLVVQLMALFFPQYVRGHHINMANVQPPLFPLRLLVGSFFPSLVITEERDQKKFFPVKDRIIGMLRETGYAHIQGTKPDTVGHGLTDSPAGLAAYILEKFSFWTNPSFIESPDGQLTKKYELDDLLNNVMVYWISGSITSSMRLYKEVAKCFHEMGSYSSAPVSVPTGYASLPHELGNVPEAWLSYVYKNVISYTAFPDGGHFAAFELPKLMAEDIRKFTKGVEDFLSKKPAE
ncbi:Epoxide hydrolase 1 [Holothuria leucospilota]|uniref:Epoxide hydrolase n=1 Tax=Holothuria leucospilota TaxID=206669 RepID=A0A9Q0YDU6_HOLLE|nr:Epoxide hydrolase 1 [Holothuria leucospilota]